MPPTLDLVLPGSRSRWVTTVRSAAPHVARMSATTTSAVLLSRRDLSVNDAQKVTLGIIAAYVVAIALLWNLPYIRWVLWPFKVRPAPKRPQTNQTNPLHSPSRPPSPPPNLSTTAALSNPNTPPSRCS